MPSRAKPKGKKGASVQVGRPPLAIDPTIVEAMASVGATNVEIADFVGCDEATVRNRFSEILTKARSGMRERLRRAQFTLAIEGNATMLIWLGKQMLGQADESRIKVGKLDELSDEELKALAAGSVPKE